MGDEEGRIIRPAIATLGAEGIDVRGPLPADTLFHPAARATYDGKGKTDDASSYSCKAPSSRP